MSSSQCFAEILISIRQSQMSSEDIIECWDVGIDVGV